MREHEKAQFAQYVEQVTGTVPIRSATDCAAYLYGIVNKLGTIHEMLCSDSAYQRKIATQKVLDIRMSLLVNAKWYEGIPIQQTLF